MKRPRIGFAARSPARLIAVATATSAALALANACFVEGFELVDLPAGQGGATASSTVAGPGGMDCPSAKLPNAPDGSDPGEDIPNIVLAIKTLSVGDVDSDKPSDVGLDLDTACTCCSCADTASTCKKPEQFAFSLTPLDNCDGTAGQDNNLQKLLRSLAASNVQVGSIVDGMSTQDGSANLILRIGNYNGKPNDETVQVAAFTSLGIDENCNPDGKAKWDGNDVWIINAAGIVGGSGNAGGGGSGSGGSGGSSTSGGGSSCMAFQHEASFKTESAFVRDGVLVASFDFRIPLTTDNPPPELFLKQGSISGKLESTQGGWKLSDGLLAGRWPMEEIKTTIPRIRVGGTPICNVPSPLPLEEALGGIFCDLRDTTSDFATPASPCDAVSVGLAFTAETALLGPGRKESSGNSSCPEYSCAELKARAND